MSEAMDVQNLRGSSFALILLVSVHCALAGCGSSESGGGGVSMDELASQQSAITAQKQPLPETNRKNQDGKLADPSTSEGILQILAPREVEVDILGVKASPEMMRIGQRMTESLQKNGRWFNEFVKANAPGQLPYHSNFGITEDEYKRYLEYLQSFKLVPMSKGRLKFIAQSNSRTLIENVEGLPEFDGIVVDVGQKQIETQWGTASAGEPIHASEKSHIGRWDGYGWKLYQGSGETGTNTVILFDVGRLSESSLSMMRVKALVASNGVKSVDKETVVLFP